MKTKTPKNKNTIMVITLGIVAVVLLLLAIIGNMRKGGKGTEPAVEVISVEKGDVSQEIEASGNVESEWKKTFYSPVNATIEMMTVESGDSVESGQKLIGFNVDNLESDNQRAELTARSGKLELEDAQAQADSAVSKVSKAKAEIPNFNVDNLESDNQRAELTARSGKLELEDAQAQADSAVSKVSKAKAEIPNLKKQIENKKNEISDFKQQIAKVQNDAQKQAQEGAENAYQTAVKAAEAKYQEEIVLYNTVTKPEYDKELEELKKKINEGTGVETDKEDYRHLLENPPKVPEMEEVNPADFQVSGTGMADTSVLEAEMENAASELASLQSELASKEALAQSEATGLTDAAKEKIRISNNLAELETKNLQELLEELQSELASKEALAQSEATGLTDAAKEKIRISNNLAELETKNLQELLEEGRKGIEAEFSGVISDTRVSQGATVTQGMELFTLQSMDDVCVDASISKYDFDKVKEGQKATIKLGDKKYNGTVEKVNRIAVPNEKGAPTIGVVIHIDNPDDGIFIGVEGKVSIHAAEAKNVPILPVEAVNIGKDASFCYVVEDGEMLFTLQSMDDVCVDASISKYDFDKVKEGQKATVKLGDKKYNGTIEKVNRIAVPNEKGAPTIGVVVHIDNPDDGIFIGVEGKVSIHAAEAKNVPILPVEAVNIGKDASFCYVVEDGEIKKKEIETGVTSDSFVEIKSGLKEGEQILVDIGNHNEGDKVKAQEAKSGK